MENTYKHLIYLMACALQSVQPEESLLKDADLDRLLLLAKRHCVAAMACTALENTAAFDAAPVETKRAWLEVKNNAIRKTVLQNTERAGILKALDDAGIWHMLLKGGILKDWYPKPWMREMADCDILIDPEKRQETGQLFLDRGYQALPNTSPVHDVYQKPPVYDFEMHHTLFAWSQDRMRDFFEDVKPRLIPVEGTACQFEFTAEELYIYLLAHAYKHFSGSGTGLRTLADVYIAHRHLEHRADWGKIQTGLVQIGIEAHASESLVLAQKLFTVPRLPEDLTNGELRLLDRYLGSGTYGTQENAVRNRIERLDPGGTQNTALLKLRYCLGRIFLSRSACREDYPFVYGHPWILPFFWIWRIVYRGLVGRKHILREFAAVKSYVPEKERTDGGK